VHTRLELKESLVKAKLLLPVTQSQTWETQSHSAPTPLSRPMLTPKGRPGPRVGGVNPPHKNTKNSKGRDINQAPILRTVTSFRLQLRVNPRFAGIA